MDGHFGGGSGTREAPYLVEDWADFASMNLMVWYALPAHLAGVNGSWQPPETAGVIDSIQYLWADGNKPKVICDRQFFPNWYVVPSDTAYPYRLRWFYYPESDYRTAVQQKTRQSTANGTMQIGDTVYPLHDNVIGSGSLQIASDAMPESLLIPGGVPSAEMTLRLLAADVPQNCYGADVSLCYWVDTENGWFAVPLGVFRVASADTDTETGINLTAYDAMNQLSNVPIGEIGITLDAGYTPYEIVALCCDAADVPLGTSSDSFSHCVNYNLRFVLSKLDGSVQTARDLVMHTMQILCAFAYADGYGTIHVQPITVYDPDDAIEIGLQQRISGKFSQAQYALKNIKQNVTIYDADGGTAQEITVEALADVGVSLELPDNPLWSTIIGGTVSQMQAVRTALNTIKDVLESIRYQPMETETTGDPTIMQCAWMLHTGGKAGGGIAAPVTSYVWRYRGTQTLTATGAEAVAELMKSQADKAAQAARNKMVNTEERLMREAKLRLIQQSFIGMQSFTHAQLENLTYSEITRNREE